MIPLVDNAGPGRELDHLRAAVEKHDRFLYWKPDSMRILDSEFWAIIDRTPTGWLFARPSCYLAIYDSATLAPVLDEAPRFGSKQDSIIWESRLHDLLPGMGTIFPDVSDRNALRIDTIDGALELVIGNTLVEKRKGTVHCRRCPDAPVPGVCTHYLRRFGVPTPPRDHRPTRGRAEVRAH